MTASHKALVWGIAASFLFTGLIFVLRPLGIQIDFLPDTGASWYYWQLPEDTTIARVTAWAGYIGHQVFMWGLIAYGQSKKLKPTKGLHTLNWIALGGNAFFIFLHWVQTHFWYGALAEDVSVFSSQGSVIMVLVLVLVMETKRRGLFFGQKINWMTEGKNTLIRYHGHLFAWATIYTFWYHPMDNTIGHLLGFFYTFMLMLQGSLIFTRAHTNKFWTATLETFVLIHGTLVAVMLGQEAWAMFLFGFATMFVVTTLHGLGLSRLTRAVVLALYAISILLVYSERGWAQLNEIIRIPVILYGLALLIGALLFIGTRLNRRRKKTRRQAPSQSKTMTTVSSTS